jgi:hypothetical protein
LINWSLASHDLWTVPTRSRQRAASRIRRLLSA